MTKYRIKVEECNSGFKHYTVESRDLKKNVISAIKNPIFWVLLFVTIPFMSIFIWEYSSIKVFASLKGAEIYIKHLKVEEQRKLDEEIRQKEHIKSIKIKSTKYIKIK